MLNSSYVLLFFFPCRNGNFPHVTHIKSYRSNRKKKKKKKTSCSLDHGWLRSENFIPTYTIQTKKGKGASGQGVEGRRDIVSLKTAATGMGSTALRFESAATRMGRQSCTRSWRRRQTARGGAGGSVHRREVTSTGWRNRRWSRWARASHLAQRKRRARGEEIDQFGRMVALSFLFNGKVRVIMSNLKGQSHKSGP